MSVRGFVETLGISAAVVLAAGAALAAGVETVAASSAGASSASSGGTGAPSPAAAVAVPPPVHIYLPRTVAVEGETIRLGDIAVVRSADAALRSACEAVPMGRAPWSGERLVLDRRTLLARLASRGLGAERFRFSGAEEVAVTRAEAVTGPDRLVETARAWLDRVRPAPRGCRWRVLRQPKPIRTPAGAKVALTARGVPHGVGGEVRVRVEARCGERSLGGSDVIFRLTYPRRRLVARRDIAPGEVVTPENTRLETYESDRPDPGTWAAAYGARAARLIPAGTEVTAGRVLRPEYEVVVHRNKSVVMSLVGPLFRITALGKALEDGRPGDLIKVQNVDSGRVVLARVAADGTVEPVLAER